MALIFWENALIKKSEKPVVALLLGTENGLYETNDSYNKAIEDAGGIPVQFGFDKVYEKLSVLKPDAVLLPGGAFKTPDCWYGQFEGDDTINSRTQAYIDMLKYAEENKLPLLGICAGMQLLAVKYCSLLLAKINGHKSKGNTFPRIIRNEETKLTPSCGCMTGTTNGTRKAVTRFIRIVYEVRCAALPPNFPVTTAAAVAVGQIRHNMAPSINILECRSGNIYKIPARKINDRL